MNIKTKEIYLSASGGDCTYSVQADLTNIPKERMQWKDLDYNKHEFLFWKENKMPLTAELEYFIQHLDGSPLKIANGENAVDVVNILVQASKSLKKGVPVE